MTLGSTGHSHLRRAGELFYDFETHMDTAKRNAGKPRAQLTSFMGACTVWGEIVAHINSAAELDPSGKDASYARGIANMRAVRERARKELVKLEAAIRKELP